MNKTAKERLESRRNIVDTCWLWTGAKYKNGYGYLRYNMTKWLVHRLSMHVYNSHIFTSDEQVNHICDNKHCFNPEHLYIGDQKDNMKDRWRGHQKQSKFITNTKSYRKNNQHRTNWGRD